MEIKKQAIYSDLYLYKTPHSLANLHGLNLQYSILLEVNFPEFQGQFDHALGALQKFVHRAPDKASFRGKF